jgi:hypothetical protein
MENFLKKYKIPYDGFTSEKIPSVAYFDDKAWRVEIGPNGLANAVEQFLDKKVRK